METRGFDASVTDTTTVTNTTAESPGAVPGSGAAARDKRQKQGRKDGSKLHIPILMYALIVFVITTIYTVTP